MKDNISLIAAAAGGFMLSVALTGLLHGTPVTNWQKSSIHSSMVSAGMTTQRTNNSEFVDRQTHKG
ncbi:hypothetical protein [Nodularia chucula]|uniref:hypothetical protein n=1 Tax=Nodularia chucula TaxID=3093667 RepID=UPI0039C701B5